MTAVVIPGVGGSKIYCDCGGPMNGERLYPRRERFTFKLDPHFYECGRVTTKILKSYHCISIYKNLINRLSRRGVECIPFSYDWRRDVHENASLLVQFLTGLDRKNVMLLGHSLGGLLVRIAFEFIGGLDPRNFSKIFICATPFYGSENIMDYNTESLIMYKIKDESVVLKNTPFLIAKTDIDQIFKVFRNTLLYLIPTYQLVENAEFPGVDPYIYQKVRLIHYELGKFKFPGDKLYHFYFNVNQCIRIENTFRNVYRRGDGVYINQNQLNQIWLKSGGRLVLRQRRRGDGVVVPFTSIPTNSTILYDTVWSKHSMVMNSSMIMKFIRREI